MSLSNQTPSYPYGTWSTAARTIQDAVDAAYPGEMILVSNGVYQTGSRRVSSLWTSNRVAITKAVTVQSVNGPEVTVIQGWQVQGSTNGSTAVRCAYLTNNAVLSGFTLSGGATASGDQGGGAWCAASAVVSNCVLLANAASDSGGGAYGGTLNNCTLSSNWAGSDGGGTANSMLTNCALAGNWAFYEGGGAYSEMQRASAYNCIFTRNSALFYGGGASGMSLQNCALGQNWCSNVGGGADSCWLYNCTLIGNWAGWAGGGLAESTQVYNCIAYYNDAPQAPNYTSAALTDCCSTPRFPGNIDGEPQLATLFHLSAISPCRGAGLSGFAVGVDLDGDAWASPPSIGCDEFAAAGPSGAFLVAMQLSYTNVAVGFAAGLVAQISGRCGASRWDFGDGITVSNRPVISHAWQTPGDYIVVLSGYSANNPGGVSATQVIHVASVPVHYVALESTNPVPPYSDWATAASSIQDAVDAATLPGALVLVNDGTYSLGGRVVPDPVIAVTTNRVAVTKPINIQSLHGATLTAIQGYQAPGTDNGVRCVYLTNGASLTGFTLTNGGTRTSSDGFGAGVRCASAGAVLSNCILSGNVAASAGGGACFGTFENCVVFGNAATNQGGGAFAANLNNCTVTENSAASNGGVSTCQANNTIIYYNQAATNVNYDSKSRLSYCCAVPLPAAGVGNITNAPRFVDLASGDVRFDSESPCINSGYNGYAPAGPDLDGAPRITAATVDLGPYEFQHPGSLISYAWLQHFALPTDGSADLADADGDGMNNWQEWLAGTEPLNALSSLRLLNPTGTASNIIVQWQSVAGRTYFLQRASNLDGLGGFTLCQTNIPGQAGITSFVDTNVSTLQRFFYRVGVQTP